MSTDCVHNVITKRGKEIRRERVSQNTIELLVQSILPFKAFIFFHQFNRKSSLILCFYYQFLFILDLIFDAQVCVLLFGDLSYLILNCN